MTPIMRRVGLTAHTTSSVGWLGATAAFLPLAIAAVTSSDAVIVRSSYIAMNLIGLYVLVPLSLAAFVTGIVQSVGTPWGLFRHYWVVTKLALTTGATLLMLVHQFLAIEVAARRAAETAGDVLPAVGELGPKLARDAGLGLFVLLVITVLGVFKPWGRTPYGRRTRARAPEGVGALPETTARDTRAWVITLLGAVVTVLMLVFAALHIAQGIGAHGHGSTQSDQHEAR